MTGKFKHGMRGSEEKVGAAWDSGKWQNHRPVGLQVLKGVGSQLPWESGTTASELAKEGCSQWVVGVLHLLAMASARM